MLLKKVIITLSLSENIWIAFKYYFPVGINVTRGGGWIEEVSKRPEQKPIMELPLGLIPRVSKSFPSKIPKRGIKQSKISKLRKKRPKHPSTESCDLRKIHFESHSITFAQFKCWTNCLIFFNQIWYQEWQSFRLEQQGRDRPRHADQWEEDDLPEASPWLVVASAQATPVGRKPQHLHSQITNHKSQITNLSGITLISTKELVSKNIFFLLWISGNLGFNLQVLHESMDSYESLLLTIMVNVAMTY